SRRIPVLFYSVLCVRRRTAGASKPRPVHPAALTRTVLIHNGLLCGPRRPGRTDTPLAPHPASPSAPCPPAHPNLPSPRNPQLLLRPSPLVLHPSVEASSHLHLHLRLCPPACCPLPAHPALPPQLLSAWPSPPPSQNKAEETSRTTNSRPGR